MKNTFHTLCFGLLFSVSSTSVQALDFLQSYKLAVNNDPDILAAQYDYQASLETRSQSRSALLPQINLDVFANKSNQDSNAITAIGNSDATGYSVSLNQSIYSHDLYKKLEQTDLQIASATASFSAQQQALILRVAEAYFDVLASEDTLAFAKAEKNAIGQQLEQTRQRFEVGLIAITDVKESQAQYDLSVASEIQAENVLLTSRETLRTIIGQYPDELSKLARQFPLVVPEPANINRWVETSKENNLAFKSAQYAYQIAQTQVLIDRSGHYPTLNLNLSHDDSSTETDTITYDKKDTSITLNLSVPIYSGGLTSARTRQAVAQKERARSLQEQSLRSTIKAARDSYLGVTASIAQVHAFKQALISTQTAYEATQAGFEVGTRTAVEVLSVLREQYSAERDFARSRYDYILNILRLKQAAGILSSQDVEQINQWLKH